MGDQVGILAQAKGPRAVRSRWHGCWPSIHEIVPIPSTRRRERLRENAAATLVALSADEVAELNTAEARLGVHSNCFNDMHANLVGIDATT